MAQEKDFRSVSPSARSLLLMKACTDIPYAKELAALVPGPEVFELSFDDNDIWFWLRVMHFENRYKSIDQLLQQAGCRNVLELSSGFSLRGLDMCAKNADLHYIDTDLQEVIRTKQDMIDSLNIGKDAQGNYELMPLNIMDTGAFDSTVARFKHGPLAIVNEGLLMYLDMEEKKQLCATIRSTLQQRGGCWITADVYVRRLANVNVTIPQSKGEANFMDQHKVEENKFESYEAARAFFEEQGFELAQEAVPDYAALSVMPHLIKVLPEEMRNSKQPPPKIQSTWMLRVRW